MLFKASVILGLLASMASGNDVVSSSSLRGLQQQDECMPVDTVADFDLETYVSAPWYIHQQAVVDFQPIENNYCARAKYSIREKGTFWGYTVDVDNAAQDVDGDTFGGPLCAYQDKDTASKLAVAPCFLPKFLAGPYWIVAYNEDEGYALISGGQPKFPSGNGDGKCKSGDGTNNAGLWIFSRSPERNETLISTVRDIADEKGFDLTVLNDVVQGKERCGYDDNGDVLPPGNDNGGNTTSPGTPTCPEDEEGTFFTHFGQKDCDWVSKWRSVRCPLYGNHCLATCSNDSDDDC